LVAIEKFEGGVESVSMLTGIVGKFYEGEEFGPGLGVDRAENGQIRFDFLIDSFGCSVSLGWNTVDGELLIPISLRASWKLSAINWGSRSEMILLGRANRVRKCRKRRSPTPSAESVLEQGMRITPLVRPWSTMTRMESNPLDVGRSVIRSIEHWEKGRGSELPSIGKRPG
jgi:hypothetical protein